MKRLFLTNAAILWAGFAMGQTITNTYVENQVIPVGSTSGFAVATNVTGISGNLTDLSVSLDVTGGFNGGLYAYLAGPNGGFVVLINRLGVTTGNPFGYGDSGIHITLDDSGSYNNIHYYQNYAGTGPVTGTWASDGENVSPLSSQVGSALSTATLSSFVGTDPNGVWTLFIADLASGPPSTLQSFSLVMTVPEPSTWAIGATGLVWLLFLHRRQKSKTAGR